MTMTTQPLPEGAIACGACGRALTGPDSAKSEVVRIGGERNTKTGELEGGVDVTFGRCSDTCSEALQQGWGHAGERLTHAARLLGYSGTPGAELLKAAGLTRADAAEFPISALLWSDFVARAVDTVDLRADARARARVRPAALALTPSAWDEMARPLYEQIQAVEYVNPYVAAISARANSCAVAPWSHLTKAQRAALIERQAVNRAKAAGTDVTIRAVEAGHLLTRAEHVIGHACFGCGAAALSCTPGSRPQDVWIPWHVSVQPFTSRLTKPGSRVGYVAFLLCKPCSVAIDKSGASPGEEFAHVLLQTYPEAAGLYDGHFDSYARGVLSGALFGAQVLQARIMGRPEPRPGKRWAHLKATPLPTSESQLRLIEMAAEADAIHARAAENANTAKALAAEIDKRATVIAKNTAQVEQTKRSMREAVTVANQRAAVQSAKDARLDTLGQDAARRLGTKLTPGD